MTAEQLMDLHRQHQQWLRSGYLELGHNEPAGRQRGKRQRQHRETRRRWHRLLLRWIG